MDTYSFSEKIVFEKNENKQKEVGVGPFFTNSTKNQKRRIKIRRKIIINLSAAARSYSIR